MWHLLSSVPVSAAPTRFLLRSSSFVSLSLCSCKTFLFSVLSTSSHCLAYLSGAILSLPISTIVQIWILATYIFQRMTRPMNWPGGARCSSHFQSQLVFFLLNFVTTLLFTRAAGGVFYQNFSSSRFLQHPARN